MTDQDFGGLKFQLENSRIVNVEPEVAYISLIRGRSDTKLATLVDVEGLEGGVALTNLDLLGWENFTEYTNSAPAWSTSPIPAPFKRLAYPRNEGRPSPWLHPVFFRKLPQVPSFTQLLLLKGAKFHVWVPISDERGISRVMREEDGPSLHLQVGKDVELEGGVRAVVCEGNDLRETLELCGNHVKLVLGLRSSGMPHPLKFLGWCSWNAFLQRVSLKDVKDAVDKLSSLGVKWAILDDGWEDVKERRLRSFGTDESKFPGGLKEAAEVIKSKMSWAGVWIATNGYWNGFDPETLSYKGVENGRGGLTPDPAEGFPFYLDYFRKVKRAGFDLVKLDNQSSLALDFGGPYTRGEFASGVEVEAHGALYGLGLDVIDCMSQLPENIHFLYRAQVIRNSMDYVPNSGDATKLHAIFNVYNALFTRWFGTPDFDMFMSHDRFSTFHALLRAISGGPVYLTDVPGRSDPQLVSKLRLSDGRLPLPDGVLTPFGDVFRDPYNSTNPLKAFNVANGSHLVLIANVNREGVEEEGSFSVGELGLGNSVVYDYFSEEVREVSPEEKLAFRLGELQFKYFIVVPKREFSPVGLVNVFVSPKGFAWGGNVAVAEDEGEFLVHGEELCTDDGRKVDGTSKVRVRRGSRIGPCGYL